MHFVVSVVIDWNFVQGMDPGDGDGRQHRIQERESAGYRSLPTFFFFFFFPSYTIIYINLKPLLLSCFQI